jgi:hypothetical protein
MPEMKLPRTARRYEWREWSGLRPNDEIIQADPEVYVLIRDGEMIVVSDNEVAIKL